MAKDMGFSPTQMIEYSYCIVRHNSCSAFKKHAALTIISTHHTKTISSFVARESLDYMGKEKDYSKASCTSSLEN